MDFRSFLQQNLATFTDPAMRAAAQIITRLGDLPPSSDPRVLAKVLYKLLDPQATKGLQTLFMFYQAVEPANEQPLELKQDPRLFLAAINEVVDLQNNDPDYRWPSPLHQQRFGKRG
ncbi:MAG: hypothetical protein IPJ76_06325 [Flavobacteriales bacterium]|nr:MAG: hypothetical protein IPJ76_06325 [Flavobacteriales bacterium]